MEKEATKKQIWEAGVKAQQSIIDDFQGRINELLASGRQYADEQHDSGALSMADDTENQAALMAEQLQMLQEEMEKLQRINPDETHESVHLGSVVVTEQQRFFVSVSLERFKADGVDYFGISTKAPIYAALEGKKQGDVAEVNGRSFKILELY
jgi:transcription elongation GreA/GreB family factor